MPNKYGSWSIQLYRVNEEMPTAHVSPFFQDDEVVDRLGAGVASLRVQCIPGAFLIDE